MRLNVKDELGRQTAHILLHCTDPPVVNQCKNELVASCTASRNAGVICSTTSRDQDSQLQIV